MRRLVILGGGTAGTMAANKLRRRLGLERWQIAVVDQSDEHLYQPGLLFVPFGTYRPEDLVKLLPGRPMPLPARMSMAGKRQPSNSI